MDTRMTRGAAVAILTLGLGAPLEAQAVSGRIQLRSEPRDSAEMRVLMVTKARLDSLATLMRQFNTLPERSPEAEAVRARMDALMPPLSNKLIIRSSGMNPEWLPKGWIGIHSQGPSNFNIGPDGYLIQYFDYPAIISVDPDSPAKKAGIVPGDVLLAYDGVDVKGHRFDLTQVLVPEKKLSIAVRHEGEPKEYTLTVAAAPDMLYKRQFEVAEMAEMRASGGLPTELSRARGELRRPVGGGFGGVGPSAGLVMPTRSFFITPNGAFGAILSTVGPELAKTLKLEPGVLVNDVSEETPASTSGLRPGDVIVAVAGQSVGSLQALQEILKVRRAERTAVLDVVRDKKPRKVTVNW